jgi:hypothetical protein
MISLRTSVSIFGFGCTLAATGCHNCVGLGCDGMKNSQGQTVPACTFDSTEADSCWCPMSNEYSPLWGCKQSACCRFNPDMNNCSQSCLPVKCDGVTSAPPASCTGGAAKTPNDPDVRVKPLGVDPAHPFGCQLTTISYQIENEATSTMAPASNSQTAGKLQMKRMVPGSTTGETVLIGKPVELPYPVLGAFGSTSPSSFITGTHVYRNHITADDDNAPLDPDAANCKCEADFRAVFSGLFTAPGVDRAFIGFSVKARAPDSSPAPTHGVFGECTPGSCGDEADPNSCR